MEKNGIIIIEPGVDVWPHEKRTAEALAASGMSVKFLRRKQGDHVRTPDVVIDGETWEMKSPQSRYGQDSQESSQGSGAIEKHNLRLAENQRSARLGGRARAS